MEPQAVQPVCIYFTGTPSDPYCRSSMSLFSLNETQTWNKTAYEKIHTQPSPWWQRVVDDNHSWQNSGWEKYPHMCFSKVWSVYPYRTVSLSLVLSFKKSQSPSLCFQAVTYVFCFTVGYISIIKLKWSYKCFTFLFYPKPFPQAKWGPQNTIMVHYYPREFRKSWEQRPLGLLSRLAFSHKLE